MEYAFHNSAKFTEILSNRLDWLKDNPRFADYFDADKEPTIELVKQIEWLIDHGKKDNFLPEWRRREVFGFLLLM